MAFRKYDLTGLRFGKLVVLKEGPLYPDNPCPRRTWICQCDCGNISTVRMNNLRNKKVNSCGCGVNPIKLAGDEASLRDLRRDYIHGARLRNLSFELNVDQFRKITSQICKYCGDSPAFSARARTGNKIHYIYNGIDRIGNSVGYILENCVPCCAVCNRMKFQLSVEDFLKHIRKIAQNIF